MGRGRGNRKTKGWRTGQGKRKGEMKREGTGKKKEMGLRKKKRNRRTRGRGGRADLVLIGSASAGLAVLPRLTHHTVIVIGGDVGLVALPLPLLCIQRNACPCNATPTTLSATKLILSRQ